MKPVLVKIDERYKPIRIVPTRLSDCKAIPGMSGATATFAFFDNRDETVPLLDYVSATVELNPDDSLLAVRFTWTTGHWTTLKTAKGTDPVPGRGYTAHFRVLDGSSVPFYLPNQPDMKRIPITLLDT